MSARSFVVGTLFGAAIVGGLWWVVDTRDRSAKLFANKERCATYTLKRQAEGEEKSDLLGTTITVQGFYSPTANTCMTNTQEIAAQAYTQRTLIDELTGKTEAYVFESTGKAQAALSSDERQAQLEEAIFFGERLKYFQGE